MLYPQFSDDVRLCKRTTTGALIGLAAMLAWALTYATLYGTNGLTMVAYLSRWTLSIGGFFLAAGVFSAFAVHILRERKSKPRG